MVKRRLKTRKATTAEQLEERMSLLNGLAQRVRAAYSREFTMHAARWGNPGRRQFHASMWWDGGVRRDADGTVVSKRQNIWLKVADWLLQQQIHPEVYMANRFRAAGRFPPRPNQLIGQRFLDEFRDENKWRREEVQIEFHDQQQTAKQKLHFYAALGWSNQQAWEGLLEEESGGLSPLFRYCLAVAEGYHDFAETVHDEAWLQYVVDYANYDKVWGAWIPERLQQAVKKLETLTIVEE